MIIRGLVILACVLGLAGAVAAHHGWGSYDASKTITVAGKVLASKYENPHVTLTVQAKDQAWTVTLAPTSRMLNRGAPAEIVAVGKEITAIGYPSKVSKDEMRAERIIVDGKTVEMR